MKPDVPLDYALFQLSPRRSRCELFIAYDGTTEKLASGLLKPFVTHLKAAEEQVACSAKSIKLEVGRQKVSEAWFTKGTVERFVRFVSTPEVLELVNTLDAEMSQLEAARKIYSQGPGDGGSGEDGTGVTATSDATKKELLRAIDVRLSAVRHDLAIACNRASAAGFNPDSISELLLFADQFGAYLLHDSCSKFSALCQRRPELFATWKSRVEDQDLRSSMTSDMSLDDVDNDPQTNVFPTQLELPEEALSPTFQPSNKTSFQFHFRHFSRESSIEIDDAKENGGNIKEKKEDISSQMTESNMPSSGPQLTRRLSVQERISMFENKQKEQSSSTGGGGGKTVVGKSADFKRLSSDLSSAGAMGSEKAVLRRWSGASDMSIDIGEERKEVDNNVSTPNAAYAYVNTGSFSLVSEDKDNTRDLGGTVTSLESDTGYAVSSQVGDGGVKYQANTMKEKLEIKPLARGKIGIHGSASFGASRESSSDSKLGSVSCSGRSESAQYQNSGTGSSSILSFDKAEDSGLIDQIPYPIMPNKINEIDSNVKGSSTGNSSTASAVEESVFGSQFKDKRKGCTVHKAEVGVSAGKSDYDSSHIETYQAAHAVEESRQRSYCSPGLHFRTFQRTVPSESEASGISLQSCSQNERSETEQVIAPSMSRSLGRIEAGKKDSKSAEKLTETSSVDFVDSRTMRRTKFQKQSSAFDQSKASKRDGGASGSGGSITGKSVSESQETFLSISTPSDQVQRPRPSRGNQELNDELKMKANALEKLFAEHKLRVPGDQSTASRKSKPVETPELGTSSPYISSLAEVSTTQDNSIKVTSEPYSCSNTIMFDASPLTPPLGNQIYDLTTPKQSIYSLTLSDESRGKHYDKYMQKRDAKLKEGWSLNKAEKEARMKAMQDSLMKSKAEMISQLTGSADRQDKQLRAEKLRYLHPRSAIRREQPILPFGSEEDEDGLKRSQKDGLFGDTYLADGSSSSAQCKSGFLNSNAESSTPHSSGTPIPCSSAKLSASAAGRRKSQPENPLAQSVPNFSDLRKENTKPSSVGSKVGGRLQTRYYQKNVSSSEDKLAVKGEKPRRPPQHMRKNSATPLELNELSLLNSDVVALELNEYDDELADDVDEFSKNVEASNGAGSITSSRIPVSKLSFNQALENENDDSTDAFESMVDEDFDLMENGKSRVVSESVSLQNSGFEDGESIALGSGANPSSLAEFPASLPSVFRFMGSFLDSPGESPGSWNSRMPYPYSFQHENSDFDACDSPIESPAYWNQIDPETARMRKKWGAAQKPLVVDPSNGQTRKDVTKGLKRFLKFGRKNRGADNAVDWVSATTSEGDDDTEDGRDSANRSSEDLRKSRMGSSNYHASDDGFSETDSFHEQVHGFSSSIPTPPSNFKLREEQMSGSALKGPKSFFSLSNFRSKGGDSKLR